MPKQFQKPRLANVDPSLEAILDGLTERTQAISADPNLSDRGKTAAFSKHAAAAYKRVEARRAPLAAKMREIERRLDGIGALALKGTEANSDEKQVFLMMVAAQRSDPKMRERFWRRLTDEHDRTEETAKLRRFVLTLPDELTNVAHARDLIELRLRPSMPQEYEELARAARAVEHEMRHIEVALDAITVASDRDVLEAEGAVGPRIRTWTPEQRAEYAARYGMDALASAIAREVLLGAESSRDRAPDEASQKLANADMSKFFEGAVNPAEAAADALLSPAT